MKLIKKVNSLNKLHNINVVLGIGCYLNVFLPFFIGVKRIACEHNSYDIASTRTKIVRFLMYRFVDYVVSSTKEDLKKYLKINKNSLSIYNPLIFSDSNFSAKDKDIVISVGTLTKRKGMDRLLSVWKLVEEKNKNAFLEIFGDGEELENLLETKDKLCLRNVSFLGSTQALDEKLNYSKIFVLPSRKEGFPMVILEAMNHYLPVVSFDIKTGPNEIITDGVDGYLIKDNDINDMAEKILKLLFDKELLGTMSFNAKKNVGRFSMSNILKRWKRFFSQMIILTAFFLIFFSFLAISEDYWSKYTIPFILKKYTVRLDILVVFVIFIIIQVLVQPTGNIDYIAYTGFYKLVEPINQVLVGNDHFFTTHITFYEIGYKVLNSVFKFFIANPVFYFLIVNIVSLLVVFSFIKHNSESFYSVLLAYYSFMYLSLQLGMIRQGLTVVIFYLSIEYLVKGDFLKYMLLIALAVTLHQSAIILIPIYFFIRKTFSIKLLVTLFVIGLCLYLMKIDIVSILVRLLTVIGQRMSAKTVYYLNNGVINNFLGVGFFDRLMIVIVLIIARIRLIKLNEYTKHINVSFNLALFNVLLQIYAFNLTMFTTRIRYYFIIFFFIVISKYISSFTKKSNKLILISILSLYCFSMFYFKFLVGE
ncbi:MAG: EpsG family protein [Bacteroidales bacterium]|nr:EpsG family protein [Bacteroidales bacterium]